jgi:hypothetical protein
VTEGRCDPDAVVLPISRQVQLDYSKKLRAMNFFKYIWFSIREKKTLKNDGVIELTMSFVFLVFLLKLQEWAGFREMA